MVVNTNVLIVALLAYVGFIVVYFVFFRSKGAAKENKISPILGGSAVVNTGNGTVHDRILKDIIVKGTTKMLILIDGDDVQMKPITADKTVGLEEIVRGSRSVRETKMENISDDDFEQYANPNTIFKPKS